MQTLAIAYRAAQLAAHNFHNAVTGPTFFADHDYLGELYPAYESAYDAVVERMIGLGMPIDLYAITKQAGDDAAKVKIPADPKAMFAAIQSQETAIRRLISLNMEGASDGTQNLLQGLADDSEMRTYKLKQRTAGTSA